MMETLLNVLAYTLPSVVMLVGVWLVLKKTLRNENNFLTLELKKQNNNQKLSVTLRAYERLILFLERTQPGSILMRQNLLTMNCLQLQTVLLKQIRDEFEHNITQQLYVSREAWALVCNAKESLVKLVNLSAGQFETSEAAIKMAEFMIKSYSESQNPPSEVAINFIKEEVKHIF